MKKFLITILAFLAFATPVFADSYSRSPSGDPVPVGNINFTWNQTMPDFGGYVQMEMSSFSHNIFGVCKLFTSYNSTDSDLLSVPYVDTWVVNLIEFDITDPTCTVPVNSSAGSPFPSFSTVLVPTVDLYSRSPSGDPVIDPGTGVNIDYSFAVSGLSGTDVSWDLVAVDNFGSMSSTCNSFSGTTLSGTVGFSYSAPTTVSYIYLETFSGASCSGTPTTLDLSNVIFNIVYPPLICNDSLSVASSTSCNINYFFTAVPTLFLTFALSGFILLMVGFRLWKRWYNV